MTTGHFPLSVVVSLGDGDRWPRGPWGAVTPRQTPLSDGDLEVSSELTLGHGTLSILLLKFGKHTWFRIAFASRGKPGSFL